MLKWIAQYDLHTGEFIEKYQSVNEAVEVTGLPYGAIKNNVGGFRKSAYGYVFKREQVCKDTLKNKKMLTVEEYMFLHDLNKAEFAQQLGISATSVSYYSNRKSRPNAEIKKKLDAIGVISDWEVISHKVPKKKHTTKGKPTGMRFYVNNEESIESLIRLVDNRKVGRICCASQIEAKFVSKVLNSHGVANYVGRTKVHGYFVKFDKTVKEEIA